VECGGFAASAIVNNPANTSVQNARSLMLADIEDVIVRAIIVIVEVGFMP